jgi:hypothetical protein
MTQLTPIRDRPAIAAPVTTPTADTGTRIIVKGLLVATVMVGLLAATQLINYGAFDLRYGIFDVDSHATVFGVASIIAEIAAAGAIVWRGSRAERHRWAWYTLGALVAALVLLRTLSNFDAKTAAIPTLLVFALVCWLTWRDSLAARTIAWLALILLALSALLHQVGLDADVLNYSNQSWSYQITAVVKHGAELAGWILILTAVIAGMKKRSAPEVTPREPFRLEMDTAAS